MDSAPTIPGVTCGYLTSDLRGIGGVIKARPEDFLVDEEPLYQPCGEGEHIYLYIEKRDLTTPQAAEILAKHFGVERRAVGYAGLKDKRAVTRQVFSVHTPGRSFEEFPEIDHPRLSTLWADMHTNKLRLGHLRANRFSIRVRAVRAVEVRAAIAIVERLERSGVPNLAGEQRFGARANNHLLGRHEVAGDSRTLLDELLGAHEGDDERGSLRAAREAYARRDYDAALASTPREMEAELAALRSLLRHDDPDRAARAIPRKLRQFWVNALQSWAFNRVVSGRIERAEFDRILPGDLAWKHDNGAVFRVDEALALDPETIARAARFEISASGPLWGPSMTRAGGEVDRAELDALTELGVSLDQIAAWEQRSGCEAPGARRAIRVPLVDPEVEGGADEHGEYVRVAFELPPGAFATIALREIMKPEAATRS